MAEIPWLNHNIERACFLMMAGNIAMDDTVGSDFLCVLYAKEELDIDAIRQRVAAASGDFVTKVKKALGNIFGSKSWQNSGAADC